MRKASLIFSLTFSFYLHAQNIVEIGVSKPYSLLNFMETAAGLRRTSSTLKSFIDGSIPGSDSSFYQLVNNFRNIQLDNSYRREGIPPDRRQFRSTYDLICIAAVESETLADFKRRTTGILANSEQQKLLSILTASESYYDRIIGVPYRDQFNRQLNEIRKLQQSCNTLFSKYRNFYNSTWTNDIPFTVALYPIPGKRGNTTATPHANSLCVGMLTEETDYAGRIGVIAHEMCHVLYDEQLGSFQYHLDSAFAQDTSSFKNLAYSYFDEALATALGNGWAYQYITTKPDTTRWYNNIYINGYAHALFPLVNQYLETNRQIDDAFIKNAIRRFENQFPKALTDYGVLLNSMYLYTDMDSRERQSLNSIITRYFQGGRFNTSSPILHQNSLESLRNTNETQLIVIDRNHEATVSQLKKIFPAMEKHLQGKKDNNYIQSFSDGSRRAIIIIYVENKDQLDRAFRQLSQVQYMDEAHPYQPIR